MSEVYLPKSEWGDGPWQTEPDFRSWCAHGLACIMNRPPMHGAWCGYVGVPPDHPWYGKKYSEIDSDTECHGGLTYCSAACDPLRFLPELLHPNEAGFLAALRADPEDRTALLVYADWLREHDREDEEQLLRRRDELWYYGFDCNHANDIAPAFRARMRSIANDPSTPESVATLFGSESPYATHYRDYDYVVAEVEKLAEQFAAARS